MEFEASPNHGLAARGRASAGPVNGQDALDLSLRVKPTSPRRVGIDYDNNAFVVFDETHPGRGVFHGHVRPWEKLDPAMQDTLVRGGMADRRGRIL
jgi:hypothetical protein